MAEYWVPDPHLSSAPPSFNHGLIPLSTTDPALFHTLLCGSALHKDQVTGIESFEKIKHMKEAIHLVNIRLQDPISQLSDVTIQVVAHLANYEVSSPCGQLKYPSDAGIRALRGTLRFGNFIWKGCAILSD
jgi:hypothetical protein